MAVTPKNEFTAITVTTPVTIVTAPASGEVRVVKYITVFNPDAAADVKLQVNDNATVFQLVQENVATDGTLEFQGTLVLDTTTQTIEAVVSAVTTQLEASAHFVDKS